MCVKIRKFVTKVIHTRDNPGYFCTVQGPTNPSARKRMLVGTLRLVPKPTGVKGSPGTKIKQTNKKYIVEDGSFFSRPIGSFPGGGWIPDLRQSSPKGGWLGRHPDPFWSRRRKIFRFDGRRKYHQFALRSLLRVV